MQKALAVSLMLLATFLFGTSNVVQKSMLGTLDVWSAIGYRGAIAFLVLLPFAVIELHRHRLGFAHVLRASGPTAVWFTIGMTAQMLASGLTTATNLGFLINICVIFVPFWIWVQSGKRPSGCALGIVALSFAGASIMSGSAPTSFGIGDAICVVSALSYSGWIVSLGRLMQSTNAPTTVTCLQWIGPATVGLVLCPHSSGSLANVASAGLELIYLGVFTSGLGFLLAAKAQALLSATAAAVCYSMEAVFGAAVAFVWLDERLTIWGMFGAALMLASMILIQWEPQKKPIRVRIEPRFA